MDGEQQSVGVTRGLGWCSHLRSCPGIVGQSFKLLAAVGIAKHYVMARPGEYCPELAANQSGTKNANPHISPHVLVE
jgi:hypothetical protein